MADERTSEESLGGKLGSEWPAKAADMVEMAVDTFFDRAVRPAIVAIRAVVFGLLIVTMGLVLLIATSIAVIRLLDVYAFGGRVWASDALIGALLCGAGLVAWSRRGTRRTSDDH